MLSVDGAVCDGGAESIAGWAWALALGDLWPSARRSFALGGSKGAGAYGGSIEGGQWVARALRNSEVVGAWRAGPPAGAGAGAAQQQSIAVPSYWAPSQAPDSSWARALVSAPPLSLVVINPDSGPGRASDPEYVAQRARAAAANVTVLGYVHTSYGKRSAATVDAEADAFFEWYSVDGIFFDEVSSSAAEVPYFAARAAAVRAHARPAGGAALVVLNPGTDLDVAYNATFDVVMAFEDSLAAYRSFEPVQWLREIDPSRVWHCVHTAGSPGNETVPLAEAVARSKALNAGRLYVTNETLPNPYAALPGGLYLEDLLRWAAGDFD